MEKYEELMKVAVGVLCVIAACLVFISYQMYEFNRSGFGRTSTFSIERALDNIDIRLIDLRRR